jgi:hypothetical protein
LPKPAAQQEETPAARARAIFDAGESRGGFDPGELSFAFEEEPEAQPARTDAQGTPALAPASRPRRIAGLTPPQLGLLGAIGLCECCLLATAVYLLTQP